MIRALIAIFIAGVLVGGALFAAVCLSARVRRDTRASDVIIVLGAQVRPSGEPSDTLRYRLNTAYEFYSKALAPQIIVCGAQGADEPIKEAVLMRDYLAQMGVPYDNILIEDMSVSTITNLENAKVIMDAQGMTSAIIVTSDYHMTRALYVARKLGIDASGASANSPRALYVYLANRFRETLSWLNTFVLWRP